MISLLVVPLTYGNAIGNLAILFALMALLVVPRRVYRDMLSLPHIWMLIACFGLLAIATLVVAGRSADALVVFDFTPLLLTLPVSAVFTQVEIPDAMTQLAWLSFCGVVVASGVALFQYFVLHNTRAGAWELSPIHFADLAVGLGFMSAVGVMNRRSRASALFALGPLLGLAAGILSGTRWSLMVACALLVLWLAFFLRPASWARALVPMLGAVIVVGTIIVAIPGAATRALDVGALFGHVTSGQTVDGPEFGFRTDQYSAALRAFADAPVFGHGWRHQVQAALPYMSPAAQQDYAVEHWHYIHNDLLNMAVGMGSFGVLAWLLLFAYPPVAVLWARRHGKLSSEAAYLVLAAWLAILVGGLTDVLLDTELTKSFYCFIPGAILLLNWQRTSQPAPAVAP